MGHLIADFDAGQKSASRRSPFQCPPSPFMDSFRIADNSLERATRPSRTLVFVQSVGCIAARRTVGKHPPELEKSSLFHVGLLNVQKLPCVISIHPNLAVSSFRLHRLSTDLTFVLRVIRN